jgi:hypothetical protein
LKNKELIEKCATLECKINKRIARFALLLLWISLKNKELIEKCATLECKIINKIERLALAAAEHDHTGC